MYGSMIIDVPLSDWMFLVVVTGSLYLGLGKRRNELSINLETREVLKFYNTPFLEKNMYVCLALVNAFYALWAKEFTNPFMIFTVPLVIIIFMKYSLDIEKNNDGDPIEVFSKDKILFILSSFYIIAVSVILYVF